MSTPCFFALDLPNQTVRMLICVIQILHFTQHLIGDGPVINGQYFIDRDAKHFRLILQYLRDQKVILPNDITLLKECLIETQYYQINTLEQMIGLKIFEITNKKSYSEWFKEISDELKDMSDKLTNATNVSNLKLNKLHEISRRLNTLNYVSTETESKVNSLSTRMLMIPMMLCIQTLYQHTNNEQDMILSEVEQIKTLLEMQLGIHQL
eukprot:550380_1